MKIAVFGASLSHQANSFTTGEPLGYAEFLRREHQKELGVSEITQLSYSGNRLGDGGLARIFDVVDYQPDICIMEMIVEDESRGLAASRQDYLFVIDQLIANAILPVLFIPPWPSHNAITRAATLLPELGAKHGIPVIQFSLPAGTDTKAYFNGVHTNAPGGKWYADEIAAKLAGLGDIAAVRETIAKSWASEDRGDRHVARCQSSREPFVTVSVEVETSAQTSVRMLQRQTIGVHSPIFHARVTRPSGEVVSEEVRSAWDPYCHYPRPSFVLLASAELPAGTSTIIIEKVAAAPDYSTCRRENVPWPPVEALSFQPLGDIFLVTEATASAKILKQAK